MTLTLERVVSHHLDLSAERKQRRYKTTSTSKICKEKTNDKMLVSAF